MLSLWKDEGSSAEVVRLTQTDEAEEMVRLFQNVAQEEGWQPEGALRLWVPRSTYFALAIEGAAERFVGGLQVVWPDGAGRLPCHDHWPEVAIGPPRRNAHVAMLAVEAEFRGQGAFFWLLGVEMWRCCVAQGIATIFIEVTPRVLPLYRRLGWPLRVQGELRCHWGEECYLCTLGIPEVAQTLLERAEHSPYYRQIVAQAFRVTLPASMPAQLWERELCPTAAA